MFKITKKIWSKFEELRKEKHWMSYVIMPLVFKMTNLMRMRNRMMGLNRHQRLKNTIRKSLIFCGNALYMNKLEISKKIVGEISFSILNVMLFNSKVEICVGKIIVIQKRIKSV